jgi:hypothetical protein
VPGIFNGPTRAQLTGSLDEAKQRWLAAQDEVRRAVREGGWRDPRVERYQLDRTDALRDAYVAVRALDAFDAQATTA